jgi:phosphonate transport system substrate-binding protein
LRIFALWLGLLSLILHAPAHAVGKELVVGVQPYQPTRALIAHHQNLAAHLRKTLKRPVRIVTASDVNAFGQRILAGDYELAIAPAHLARLAQRDYGWHPLARHTPDTSALLLARKDKTDYTVDSLRGKVLATHGRLRLVSLVAEHWLAERDLQAERDYSLLETASPASAVNALIGGQADMATVTLASMAQVRRSDVAQVRIVQEISSLPLLFFVARADMTPDRRAQLQRALLDYPTPQGGGMVTANEQDLASMDNYLEHTHRLLQASALPSQSTQRAPR